jgi:hypothetical protein
MSYIKDARSGAVGNTRLQAKYGAGSTPPRQHYAKGGRVASGEAPGPGEEIAASGKGAKRSFARSAKMRKRADGGPADGTASDADANKAPPLLDTTHRIGKAIKNIGRTIQGKPVERADGGWTGEGDSGKPKKEQAAAETQRADDRDTEATAQSISSGTLGAAGADALKRGRFGRGALGMGVLAAGQLGALYNSRQAREARKAAADANREADKAEGRKRGGRAHRASGGSIATGSPADEEDRPVEQAGIVDSIARGAARLLGRGKNVPKEGGPSDFIKTHREKHPELYKAGDENMAKMKAATEANEAAKSAGKTYPSKEWKALFPERKNGGRSR